MVEATPTIPQGSRSGARRLEYFHAASGLVFVVTMIAGWFIVAAQGMPDLSSGRRIYDAYRSHSALPTTIFVMTVGFFFSLWFLGVLLGRMREAEGSGPLTWIAAGGGISFTTVFMAGLAMGLANSLAVLKGHGADVASVYVTHLASLLTGPTTGMCGAAFFGAFAIVVFDTGMFPRWIGWLSVAAVVGSMTPMLGFWSLTGPLNVGSGLIGVQTIAGTWGVFAAAVSVFMLRELRRG
jgi:hypothetical protein